MKRGTDENPKFRRLVRLLGCGHVATVGHLELLWHFVARQAPLGDIGRWSDEDIAAGCYWDGDATALVDALVVTRWLDPCPAHRLVVHDWDEHADDGVKKTLKRRWGRANGVEKLGECRTEIYRATVAIPEESRGSWRAWIASFTTKGSSCPDMSGTCPPAPPLPPRPATPRVPLTRCPDMSGQQASEHPLTDPARTDLDADPRPKPEPPPPSEPVSPQDPSEKRAREVAHSAAERWKALRLVIAPNDRNCQAGTWSVDSSAFKERLVPHARELGDELAPAITWAMADVRNDPRFPGWRTVLRTPAKVLESLDKGALIEQFRAQRDAELDAAKRERETGHARNRNPEPPDYQAQHKVREAEEARRAAEARAAVAPPPAAREALRRIAGGSP